MLASHLSKRSLVGFFTQTLRACCMLLLVSCGLLAAACTSEDNSNPVYDNWTVRNTAAFADTLRVARTEIAKARAQYGEKWEEHTPWRVYGNYTLGKGGNPTAKDSVVVRVLSTLSEETKLLDSTLKSARPLFTDTVRVDYIGRLMPTVEYPKGKIFDHTGPSSSENDVFNTMFNTASKLAVSTTVVGFSTALQQMHLGDRWRVFIPAKGGYGNTTTQSIPAGSMLTFDLQLRSFWHAY